MPTYSISAPDGQTYKIDGPEGASQADVQAEVLKQHPQAGTPKAAPTQKEGSDTLDHALKVLKGYGNMVAGPVEAGLTAATGAIAKPLGDLEGLGTIGSNAIGLTNADPGEQKAKLQQMLTYQPQTQGGQDTSQALGKVGDALFGGLGRGAQGLTDQGLQAAGMSPGASGPIAAGVGEAANQLPGLMGLKAPAAGASALATAKQAAVDAAPRQAALQSAHDAGYLIPPAEMTSAPVGNLLTGVAGKDQINRGFALANQKVTNNLAKGDLGIPPDVPFDKASVAAVQAKMGTVYDTIKKADQTQIPVTSTNGVPLKGPTGQPLTKPAGAIQVDPQFKADVQNIGADRANADFGTKIDQTVQDLRDMLDKPSFSTKSAIDKITDLRNDARTNLSTIDDVTKKNLGKAQQQAATALESQVDRYLQSTGQPGLMKAYQSARETLAKAHTIEDAMGADGDIDAAAINRYAKNGGKVSGGLQQIASAADTIGNVVRNTNKVSEPEAFSKMQFLASVGSLATGGGQAAGHAGAVTGGALGALAGGPAAARGLIGSKAYQGTMGGMLPTANPLAKLAANQASPLAGLLPAALADNDQ